MNTYNNTLKEPHEINFDQFTDKVNQHGLALLCAVGLVLITDMQRFDISLYSREVFANLIEATSLAFKQGNAVTWVLFLTVPIISKRLAAHTISNNKEYIAGDLGSMSCAFSTPLILSKSRCDFNVHDDVMVNIGSGGAYIETIASDFTKSNALKASFIGNLALDLCPILDINPAGNSNDFASQYSITSEEKSVHLSFPPTGPFNDLANNEKECVEENFLRSFFKEATPVVAIGYNYTKCINANLIFDRIEQNTIISSNTDSVTSTFTTSFNTTESRRDFGSNDNTVSFGSGGTVTDAVADIYNDTWFYTIDSYHQSIGMDKYEGRINRLITSDWDSVSTAFTTSFNITKSRRDFGPNDNTVSFGSGSVATAPSPSINTLKTVLIKNLMPHSLADTAKSTADNGNDFASQYAIVTDQKLGFPVSASSGLQNYELFPLTSISFSS